LHTLKAGDFVEALLDLAREQRATQVFIGHSLRRRGWFVRTPVDRLIDAAHSFDVRVFPHKGVA
jgi:K+-sensing histidine kinase KdpD